MREEDFATRKDIPINEPAPARRKTMHKIVYKGRVPHKRECGARQKKREKRK